MGFTIAGVVITSLSISYADLPDYAYSYDGESREISQFYEQDIPNWHIGGHYIINDNWYTTFNVDTGTHTNKLNTAGLDFGVGYHEDIDSEWSYNVRLSSSLSYTKHTPCTDSYNREYYCANLTAFSDIKEESYEISNPEISISLSRNW